LGADNVLAGSDFPIVGGPIRLALTNAMRQAEFTQNERDAVAAGNCVRLLGLSS
jgi:hypothetical protein